MGAWAPSRSATARGHGCNSHRAGRAVGLVHRTIGTSACAVKSAPAWQHGVAELRLSSIDTPASLVDQVPLRRAAHAPRLHRMPTTPPKRKPVSCRTSAPPSGTSSSGLHVRHRAQLLQHNRAHLRKARHSPRAPPPTCARRCARRTPGRPHLRVRADGRSAHAVGRPHSLTAGVLRQRERLTWPSARGYIGQPRPARSTCCLRSRRSAVYRRLGCDAPEAMRQLHAERHQACGTAAAAPPAPR